MNKTLPATFVAVTVALMLANMKSADAKLVYDQELQTVQVPAEGGATVVYRDPVADVNAERAQIAAPAAQQEAPTFSEMTRRSRVRAELRNEDLLTQKLEALRLQEEVARTEKLMGSGIEKPAAPAPLTEQRVGTSATEPAPAAAMNQTAATVKVANPDEDEDKSRFSISPRGGMSGITNSAFDIQSDYSLGLGLGVDINDYFTFEAGYTYTKYRLAAGGGMMYNPYNYGLQQLGMDDHMFDAGVRASFLPSKAKVRPFIGGGFGYRRSYLNYDDNSIQMMRQYNPYAASGDVELSAFLGYVEAGLEFKVTKLISITGMGRFYNVFSSRQTNPVSPYGFVNPNGAQLTGPYGNGLVTPYGANNVGYSDTRAQAANSLADNNIYQLMLGLSFNF